jgi:hypothetical protein
VCSRLRVDSATELAPRRVRPTRAPRTTSHPVALAMGALGSSVFTTEVGNAAVRTGRRAACAIDYPPTTTRQHAPRRTIELQRRASHWHISPPCRLCAAYLLSKAAISGRCAVGDRGAVHETRARSHSNQLSSASRLRVAGQFLWVPSCSIVRAFSTLSVPDAWLGGYSVNVARNSPTMFTAGTMVHSFSPHQRP